MHDIENCCSLLYICLWLFKYTKCSAVFFCSILNLSLHFPDEPNILLSYTEKFHSSIEDLVGILKSELNSYVHWTLDRGNIKFEDELYIKL